MLSASSFYHDGYTLSALPQIALSSSEYVVSIFSRLLVGWWRVGVGMVGGGEVGGGVV